MDSDAIGAGAAPLGRRQGPRPGAASPLRIFSFVTRAPVNREGGNMTGRQVASSSIKPPAKNAQGRLCAVEPRQPSRHDAKGEISGMGVVDGVRRTCPASVLTFGYPKTTRVLCRPLDSGGSFFEPFDACGAPGRNLAPVVN